MGHEFIGVVEETGPAVQHVKPGDLAVVPFTYADNTCENCRRACRPPARTAGQWGVGGVDGGQGQAARVPTPTARSSSSPSPRTPSCCLTC